MISLTEYVLNEAEKTDKNKKIDYLSQMDALPADDLEGRLEIVKKQINHYARLSRTKEIKSASVESKKELLNSWNEANELRTKLAEKIKQQKDKLNESEESLKNFRFEETEDNGKKIVHPWKTKAKDSAEALKKFKEKYKDSKFYNTKGDQYTPVFHAIEEK